MAILFLADALDTLLKGMTYTRSLGVFYPVRTVVYVLLSVLAIVIDNPRFHAAFAVVAMGLEVALFFASYGTSR